MIFQLALLCIVKMLFHYQRLPLQQKTMSIPKTKDIIRLNAFLAHGWFNSNRWIQNVYLHEKYLYLNIKYKFFDAKAGIVHNVQWGGHKGSYKLPNDLRTYFEVIMAKSSSSKIAPPGEVSNIVGNSIGIMILI